MTKILVGIETGIFPINSNGEGIYFSNEDKQEKFINENYTRPLYGNLLMWLLQCEQAV